YAAYTARVEQLFEKMATRMGDPEEVAALVTRLLSDPRPRLRYPLGPGVPARLWSRRLLPFEGVEQVMKRILGF
ncbi:MAG: hypothetical protein KC619_00605, partial [Myxococcales bacterium]|nr:hypothetical protein [Myxococcales bacterium]